MTDNPIQLREQNPDETDKMAQFESPDGDAICASYIDRDVADQLGEYAEVTVAEAGEEEVSANLSKTTTNYGVYETPGGHVTGLYVTRDVLDDMAGDEEEAPESISLVFSPSDEDAFESAREAIQEEAENEAEGLIAGDSDDEEEEEAVEISDEELNLVDAE